MKKRVILFFSLSLIVLLLSAFEVLYTSGCPYHTGSPADGLTCNACHSGGLITPTISITTNPVLFSGNLYSPGTTYTISVSGNGYPFYGFDFEILNSQSSLASSVLDFGNLNTISPSETINSPAPGWTYSDIMHSAPKASSFNFIWTAPLSGTGYLYCALLGVNNNGSTSGDHPAFKTMTLSPVMATSISEKNASDSLINFSIFPNPCIDHITINYNINSKANIQIALFDNNGSKVLDIINEEKNKGIYELKFNIPFNLSKGLYFLKMEANGIVKSEKLFLN